ncbi:DUF1858 domain-containing protein [Rhodoplanes serenus]
MIDSDRLVVEVMRETPATVRVFLDHRMRCVGCPIGPFHTVADACREHGIDPVRFIAALRAAAAAPARGVPLRGPRPRPRQPAADAS